MQYEFCILMLNAKLSRQCSNNSGQFNKCRLHGCAKKLNFHNINTVYSYLTHELFFFLESIVLVL